MDTSSLLAKNILQYTVANDKKMTALSSANIMNSSIGPPILGFAITIHPINKKSIKTFF